MQVLSLGWEDPLEKGMATHSSVLEWRILMGTRTSWLFPWGLKELDMMSVNTPGSSVFQLIDCSIKSLMGFWSFLFGEAEV